MIDVVSGTPHAARASGRVARVGARIRDVLEAPVDIAFLAAFRVLFGLTMSISMLRFLAYGWIDTFFVAPTFHFKYWGFGWLTPLAGPLMHALFWLLAGLGITLALGLFFRLSAGLFALGFAYLQLVDVTTYLNHYYLACLLALLLAFSPAGCFASLDVLRAPRIRVHTLPAFWLYLLRFQVGVVYTFAGLAKLHGDWLLHGQPLSIWLSSHGDMPVLGPLLAWPHAAIFMSWAGFLFDSTVVLWLLIARTRPYAYVAVVVFHLLTRLLFPIGMFPVIMILGALVFFGPSWPRTLLGRLRSRVRPPRPSTVQREPRTAPAKLNRATLLVAGVYCAVQLALPLRFLAYGGNVRWHEQGMRWSWRVMVREKNGSVTFHVRSKQSHREWEVSPHRYLTRLQEREMAGQPDLILQLAHHLRDEFARKGHGAVEVRATAYVSLNGRRMALLLDPNVDLTSVNDGLGLAPWILPAPEEPPPQRHVL